MRCNGEFVEFQFIGGTHTIDGNFSDIITISDALSDYRPENNLYSPGLNNTLYRYGSDGKIRIARVAGTATTTTLVGTVYWRLK